MYLGYAEAIRVQQIKFAAKAIRPGTLAQCMMSEATLISI